MAKRKKTTMTGAGYRVKKKASPKSRESNSNGGHTHITVVNRGGGKGGCGGCGSCKSTPEEICAIARTCFTPGDGISISNTGVISNTAPECVIESVTGALGTACNVILTVTDSCGGTFDANVPIPDCDNTIVDADPVYDPDTNTITITYTLEDGSTFDEVITLADCVITSAVPALDAANCQANIAMTDSCGNSFNFTLPYPDCDNTVSDITNFVFNADGTVTLTREFEDGTDDTITIGPFGGADDCCASVVSGYGIDVVPSGTATSPVFTPRLNLCSLTAVTSLVCNDSIAVCASGNTRKVEVSAFDFLDEDGRKYNPFCDKAVYHRSMHIDAVHSGSITTPGGKNVLTSGMDSNDALTGGIVGVTNNHRQVALGSQNVTLIGNTTRIHGAYSSNGTTIDGGNQSAQLASSGSFISSGLSAQIGDTRSSIIPGNGFCRDNVQIASRDNLISSTNLDASYNLQGGRDGDILSDNGISSTYNFQLGRLLVMNSATRSGQFGLRNILITNPNHLRQASDDLMSGLDNLTQDADASLNIGGFGNTVIGGIATALDREGHAMSMINGHNNFMRNSGDGVMLGANFASSDNTGAGGGNGFDSGDRWHHLSSNQTTITSSVNGAQRLGFLGSFVCDIVGDNAMHSMLYTEASSMTNLTGRSHTMIACNGLVHTATSHTRNQQAYFQNIFVDHNRGSYINTPTGVANVALGEVFWVDAAQAGIAVAPGTAEIAIRRKT